MSSNFVSPSITNLHSRSNNIISQKRQCFNSDKFIKSEESSIAHKVLDNSSWSARLIIFSDVTLNDETKPTQRLEVPNEPSDFKWVTERVSLFRNWIRFFYFIVTNWVLLSASISIDLKIVMHDFCGKEAWMSKFDINQIDRCCWEEDYKFGDL